MYINTLLLFVEAPDSIRMCNKESDRLSDRNASELVIAKRKVQVLKALCRRTLEQVVQATLRS